MQWTVTAAEIDGMRRNRLQRLCKFVFFVCACTMDVSLPHPTSILGVKICDQETGTNLHTQERPKDLNAPAAHRPSVMFSCHVLLFVMFSLAPYLSYASWYLCACTPFLVGAICHVLLSRSPFCHVLSGAISIIRELVLVRMYTFSGWRHLSCSPVTFSCHVLLFVMFSLADTKTWRDTSTSSTHHHDESLLL
jgi:hypothetical protein